MCASTDATESVQRILTEAALAQQPQQLSASGVPDASQPASTGAAPAQQHEQQPADEVMAEMPVLLPLIKPAAVPTDFADSKGARHARTASAALIKPPYAQLQRVADTR